MTKDETILLMDNVKLPLGEGAFGKAVLAQSSDGQFKVIKTPKPGRGQSLLKEGKYLNELNGVGGVP